MLQDYQKKYGLDYSIGQVTPTVCSLIGIRIPRQCEVPPIAEITACAKERFPGGKAQKILIYNPDAIGDDMFRRYPELLAPVDQAADFRFRSAAVMKSVTPVCFATIFSGADPEVHGIKVYEKKVLEVETLFDVLAEAGLNVAIVSVNNCSIDTIFRKRQVDYYSLRCCKTVFEMTCKLLRNENYDVIISYNGEFDSSVHHNGGPYSAHSQGRLREAADRYLALNALTDEVWAKFDRVTLFAPDHGAHPEGENGSHGDDIPEDMIVNHFYRLRAGN